MSLQAGIGDVLLAGDHVHTLLHISSTSIVGIKSDARI